MAKRIVVELNRQGLTAFDGTTKVHEFDCATGDSDHPTPMGIFKISRRHRLYVSKTYNVRMDCAMFFHKGYAIHQAYAVGPTSYLRWLGIEYFGSHGCVRLSKGNALTLFEWTPMHTVVEVRL